MPKKRNYSSEYTNYHSKPKAKKVRALNNKANRAAGTYGNGDGVDIAHTKPKAKGKTFKQSPSKNRSIKRTAKAKRKSK
jgi:ribosomal protein S17